MRVLVRCAALLVAVASPVAAQSPIGVGTSAGVVKLTDQRSEEALSGVLEYQPNPWLSLYAIPAVLHQSDNVNGRPVSSSGLGDLPLVVAASYASPTPGSPTVGDAYEAATTSGRSPSPLLETGRPFTLSDWCSTAGMAYRLNQGFGWYSRTPLNASSDR